jgi:hypothetical protein
MLAPEPSAIRAVACQPVAKRHHGLEDLAIRQVAGLVRQQSAGRQLLRRIRSDETGREIQSLFVGDLDEGLREVAQVDRRRAVGIDALVADGRA